MIPQFNSKTLERIKDIFINDYEYREHSASIKFFVELGFAKDFVEEHLTNNELLEKMLVNINGSPYIDKCVTKLLSPLRFTQNFKILEQHIEGLNQFLVFDHFKIVRTRGKLTLRNMYQAYGTYCPQNGHKVLLMHDFSRLMKLLGKDQRKSGPCRYWSGLKLKTSPNEADPLDKSVENSMDFIQQDQVIELGGSMNESQNDASGDLNNISEPGVDQSNSLRTSSEAAVEESVIM